jgi:hypothetical protein
MKESVSDQLSAVSADKAMNIRLSHDYFVWWAVPTGLGRFSAIVDLLLKADG